MTVGEKLIQYYQEIKQPAQLPKDIELLFPFEKEEVIGSITAFYNKYFDDSNERVLLLGINPGRFGGGVTGIPFTDPKIMEDQLSLPNEFDKRSELSSQFIYQMIDHLGGPADFYSKFLISSVCPLGFMQRGKNLNYYDDRALQDQLEEYMVDNIRWHLDNVASREVIYSLGQGKNVKYLEYLNKKYQLFDTLIALPHPRWILQYRRKRLTEFLALYKDVLIDKSSELD